MNGSNLQSHVHVSGRGVPILASALKAKQKESKLRKLLKFVFFPNLPYLHVLESLTVSTDNGSIGGGVGRIIWCGVVGVWSNIL